MAAGDGPETRPDLRDQEFALGGPGELSEREQAAVEACLRALADDEFVTAERYTEWQVRGPTLEGDLAIANIAQDELGHARLWYDLLADFGYDETDLIWERDPAAFRQAAFVERPYEPGNWTDAVLRGYLYDTFEALRLGALADSASPRIADRVGKVRGEEQYHRDHARNWLERLCEDRDGRDRVQTALDDLFGPALTLFEPPAREDDIVELGVRPVPLRDLRAEWLDEVVPFLTGLGLTVPVSADADPAAVDALCPDERGRDGEHTDDWFALFDQLTFSYRQLDRSEAPRLMVDPDEADGGEP
jgi:ring-1,2-phenylacetyl-CoA epoxidase subunit PaaC